MWPEVTSCDVGVDNLKSSEVTWCDILMAPGDTSRFTGGERIDCAIADLDLEKRKVSLSIKLLEEIQKKEALDKYGAEGSGKNLPFSSLSDDLDKKKEK